MAEEKKIVRGGFRATLALIVSIIAIILAIMAFNRSGGEADLRAQIKDLQTKMEKMKKESSKRIDKLRDDTANILEKIGKGIQKKKKEGQESKP
jgi:hypothetical protein